MAASRRIKALPKLVAQMNDVFEHWLVRCNAQRDVGGGHRHCPEPEGGGCIYSPGRRSQCVFRGNLTADSD